MTPCYIICQEHDVFLANYVSRFHKMFQALVQSPINSNLMKRLGVNVILSDRMSVLLHCTLI